MRRGGRGWRSVAAQAGAGAGCGRPGAMQGARIYFWAFHQDDREGRGPPPPSWRSVRPGEGWRTDDDRPPARRDATIKSELDDIMSTVKLRHCEPSKHMRSRSSPNDAWQQQQLRRDQASERGPRNCASGPIQWRERGGATTRRKNHFLLFARVCNDKRRRQQRCRRLAGFAAQSVSAVRVVAADGGVTPARGHQEIV